MRTKVFSKEEKRHIRIQSLAAKHSCSREYVTMILDGNAGQNSVLARKIIQDATDILEVINRETKVTL